MKKSFLVERGLQLLKKILALLLAVLLLSGCSAGEIITVDYDFTPVIDETMAKTVELAPELEHSHIYGEWCVVNGLRFGKEIPESWYDTYYENLCKTMVEMDGKLSSTKHTTYSRVVIALSALGKDITNVAGYNLLDNYMEMDAVMKQGIPGAIFALIALDCGNYDLQEGSDVTRKALVNALLDAEFENGGWAIIGDEPDVDITAQVLQALAPYVSDERVKVAVERGVAVLAGLQNEDGGYSGWGGFNSQSNAQVIIALTSLGINLRTDERFIKGENWLGSYLMKYYLGDGQFEHTLGNGYDAMATNQCLQALMCIDRFDKGETRFYDFSDLR